jgi:hypothetical protein
MVSGRDSARRKGLLGQTRWARHPAPPRVSLVPGAGIQTVGEGLAHEHRARATTADMLKC